MSDSKVLIVGGGAREEALRWAFWRDLQNIDSVRVTPGNGDAERMGVEIKLEGYTPKDIIQHVRTTHPPYSLVIVGSENDLAKGITNEFQADEKLPPVFGPRKEAAIINPSIKLWNPSPIRFIYPNVS